MDGTREVVKALQLASSLRIYPRGDSKSQLLRLGDLGSARELVRIEIELGMEVVGLVLDFLSDGCQQYEYERVGTTAKLTEQRISAHRLSTLLPPPQPFE